MNSGNLEHITSLNYSAVGGVELMMELKKGMTHMVFPLDTGVILVTTVVTIHTERINTPPLKHMDMGNDLMTKR